MVWAVLVLSAQICVNLLRVFCFGCFVRVWWVHFLYFWGSGCFFYEFFVCVSFCFDGDFAVGLNCWLCNTW